MLTCESGKRGSNTNIRGVSSNLNSVSFGIQWINIFAGKVFKKYFKKSNSAHMHAINNLRYTRVFGCKFARVLSNTGR